MIPVYKPADMVEAQCLKDMLEHRKIRCHIQGEYLLGGVGELPASGLLELFCLPEDAELARELIQDYLTATPVAETDLSQDD
ncbi:putative signal transducing protein [Endozoicomonadaceae bacterium StTr2]